MRKIKIVTDSACDIPKELEERYQIRILPFSIAVGDESYTERKDFTNEEFYQILATSPRLPTTSQYTAMQAALSDYDEVELQYRTWSRNWMHDESSPVYVPVDRLDVLDLAEEYLMPYGTVNSLVVDGDVMIVTMSGMDLEQISAMFQRLQLQPIVRSATLTLAATPQASASGVVDFSVTVTLQSDDAETEAAQ